MTELNNPGDKPEFKWIPLKQLHIDNTYQRSTGARRSQQNLENLRANFTWRHCGVLVVAWDKTLKRYHVIDGQHRLEAASSRGDIDEMPCFVIKEANTQEQAQSFVAINKNRVSLHYIASFHAKAAAGDKAARETLYFLSECGIIVPKSPIQEGRTAPNELQCIGTIQQLLATHTKEQIKWAFSVIEGAFPNKNGCMKEMIIKMLTGFRKANLNADRDIAVTTLADINPRTFEEEARSAARMQGGKTLTIMLNAFSKLYRKNGGESPDVLSTKVSAGNPANLKRPTPKASPAQAKKEEAHSIIITKHLSEKDKQAILRLKKERRPLSDVIRLLNAENSRAVKEEISRIYYGSAA